MVWFKVDDSFHSSRKVLRIPRGKRHSAIGLWLIAGTWCANNLTDGRIEQHELDELGARRVDADTLVEAGLWERHGDAFLYHNWAKYQPTRAEVVAAREKEAERKRRARAGNVRADSGRTKPGLPPDKTRTPAGQNPESGHPDPTRPDPTSSSLKKSESAFRGTRLTRFFAITDEMRDWARKEVPLVDVDARLSEFIDYWMAVPGQKGVKLDWVSTWRNGMRKQQEFAERDRPATKLKVDPDAWMYR